MVSDAHGLAVLVWGGGGGGITLCPFLDFCLDFPPPAPPPAPPITMASCINCCHTLHTYMVEQSTHTICLALYPVPISTPTFVWG